MVSQKDIASALSLSRVTVNKALKNDQSIAVNTRELVQKKAREMGYIPDLIGRSLSSKKTYTIGVVLPKIAHSFFSKSIEYMYEAAQQLGYHIIPMISFESAKNELRNIETLLSMQVEGIIVDMATDTIDYTIFNTVQKRNTPLVFFDRYPIKLKESAVVGNDHYIAKKVTQIAIDQGYQKIVHFYGPQHISIGKDRLNGFKEALIDNGIQWEENKAISSGYTFNDGYMTFKEFFKDGNRADFIIAVNDSCAHGIYKAAQELGYSIPLDFGIIGFGNVEISHLLTPPLSSVDMPLRNMAQSAVQLLINMIENKNIDKPQVIVHDCQIIERQSHLRQ